MTIYVRVADGKQLNDWGICNGTLKGIIHPEPGPEPGIIQIDGELDRRVM